MPSTQMAPSMAPGSEVSPPMTVMVKTEIERSGVNVVASTLPVWKASSAPATAAMNPEMAKAASRVRARFTP